jgi:hypothetical protein
MIALPSQALFFFLGFGSVVVKRSGPRPPAFARKVSFTLVGLVVLRRCETLIRLLEVDLAPQGRMHDVPLGRISHEVERIAGRECNRRQTPGPQYVHIVRIDDFNLVDGVCGLTLVVDSSIDRPSQYPSEHERSHPYEQRFRYFPLRRVSPSLQSNLPSIEGYFIRALKHRYTNFEFVEPKHCDRHTLCD